MMGEPGQRSPWIDVTRAITPGMPVWPGDPPVEEQPLARVEQGAVSNVTRFMLGSHTGTHVDPPKHLEPGGDPVDALDLETLCGPCRLLDLADAMGHITAADLESSDNFEPAGETRLLLRTRNASHASDLFDEGFIAITEDAAGWLVRQGVRLVGIDGPSIEAFNTNDFAVHHTLLQAGVIIIEGLELGGLEEGRYDMVCAPLKWRDADGAPARVLLRRFEEMG
jgi:arylformamidase